jgi:hypothetical protein
MIDPNARPPDRRQVYVALRIALGVVFLLPGLCGGVFYGAALGEWLSNGLHFAGGENFTAVFVIFAAPSILLSVVLLGILARFAVWRHAPRASLVLAIVATITVILGYGMLYDDMASGSAGDGFVAIFTAIVLLGISALPPFLHWWRAR